MQGSKNKTVHWMVTERDKMQRVVSIHGFRTAKECASFLNVSPRFIFNYAYQDGEMKTRNRPFYSNKGKHADLFARFSIKKIKNDLSELQEE